MTLFECYDEEHQKTPKEVVPEPTSPDRDRGLQKVGIWERADFGVWEFQYPEGRGAPPPSQVYRRVTFIFDPSDFEGVKRSGIVWENHEGELLQDMWFQLGTANRDFLQGDIAQSLGLPEADSAGP